jgi:chromosome partitioning protein
MTIICIANQKGGVAKTTTAVTLAHGLAIRGKKVLLVDLDPQGQAATLLGVDQGDNSYEFLVSRRAAYHQVMAEVRERLYLIPGNKEIGAAQAIMRDKPVEYLADKLAPALDDGFDYVILDTAPSVGDIQIRAIYSCNYLLIPSAVDFLSSEGVYKLTETAEQIKQMHNWRGQMLGILPTFFDQTKESRANIDDLKKQFRKSILDPVHRATLLRECAAAGQTIWEVDPNSRAAMEYSKLVDYVLKVTK